MYQFNLENDFKRLLKHGCQKKTHFECVYPFLYVYEWIKKSMYYQVGQHRWLLWCK